MTGVVQGVGMRPFVHRLADRHGLGGWVRNDGVGVVIEVEGAPAAIDAFATGLVDEAPPLTLIAGVSTHAARLRVECSFSIRRSAALAAARVCELASTLPLVVLTGGCFQNVRPLARVRALLLERGFRVLSHARVPRNDGGLSYGQAPVAARRTSQCA